LPYIVGNIAIADIIFMMEKFKIDCLIIGGGVAGLAIGKSIGKHFKNIFLVEKNNYIGQETSSRNSEVIHAGIYYKKDSLKSEFCIDGKILLYEYLKKNRIPYNNCGKYILANTDEEIIKLQKIKENAFECGVDDLKYDDLSIKKYGFLNYKDALFSPSSGIFDSHTYMNSLRNEFEQYGGSILFGNKLLQITKKAIGFDILIFDKNSNQEFVIETKYLINAAGIDSVRIANLIFGYEKYKNKFIKGEYYNYSGKEKLKHLIYPVPSKYSVGLHATIDLGQGIRFGPSSYEVQEIEYKHSDKQKNKFYEVVKGYWPNILKDELTPSYTGIRPMLDDTDDFVIDIEKNENSLSINILGYASPGLTSSLALSKNIEKRILENI
jgi:L-2-hydroxyglutarate oxidase LhgO